MLSDLGFEMVCGFLVADIGFQIGHAGGNGGQGDRIDRVAWPGSEEIDQYEYQRDKEPPSFSHILKFPEFIKFLLTNA